jgi:hypothetical protein
VADSLTWAAGAVACGDEEILLRVGHGAIRIGERELRRQLERKDNHPLAQEDELLGVLAQMKGRGLIEAELCLRLIPMGRALLAELGARGRARS